MKRLFILALIALSMQIASAHDNTAILHLRMQDQSPMTVMLDGHETDTRGITADFNGLMSGPHYLQVFQITPRWGHWNKVKVFQGFIHLTGNTESYVTVLNGLNKIRFDQISAIYPSYQHQQHEKPLLFLDPKLPMVQAPVNNYQNNQWENCGPVPMNDADFQQLKNAVHNGSFESTRINILKQALRNNYLTTAQVCALLNEFWFDSSKLEVAKLAYSRTVDKNNYYLVNNSFSFSSSVDDLSRYLAMN